MEEHFSRTSRVQTLNLVLSSRAFSGIGSNMGVQGLEGRGLIWGSTAREGVVDTHWDSGSQAGARGKGMVTENEKVRKNEVQQHSSCRLSVWPQEVQDTLSYDLVLSERSRGMILGCKEQVMRKGKEIGRKTEYTPREDGEQRCYYDEHHAQILLEESMMKLISNKVFFFAGTVSRPYCSLKFLLVVLVIFTQPSGMKVEIGYNLEEPRYKIQTSSNRTYRSLWHIKSGVHSIKKFTRKGKLQAIEKRSTQMVGVTPEHTLWTVEVHKINWMKQSWTSYSGNWLADLQFTWILHDLMRSLLLVVLVLCTQSSTSELWGSVITVQEVIGTQSLSWYCSRLLDYSRRNIQEMELMQCSLQLKWTRQGTGQPWIGFSNRRGSTRNKNTAHQHNRKCKEGIQKWKSSRHIIMAEENYNKVEADGREKLEHCYIGNDLRRTFWHSPLIWISFTNMARLVTHFVMPMLNSLLNIGNRINVIFICYYFHSLRPPDKFIVFF